MRRPMENARAGDAGAIVRSGRIFAKQNCYNRDETQTLPGPDECIWRLARALRKGRLEGWGINFARSILRHNRRRGWMPTPKQLASMRNLVAKLVEPNEALIDGGDNDWAA